MTMMMGMRRKEGDFHLAGEGDEFGSCVARKTLRLDDRRGRIGAAGYGGRGRGWLAFFGRLS